MRSRKSGIRERLALTTSLAVLSGTLIASAVGAGTALAATRDVCPSGCTYSTIQAAVIAANPGDTITVGAGTYNEVVSINKDLTLEGAQAGVAGDSHSGSESTVTGFNVNGADVTIDGFEIVPGSSNSGVGVRFQNGNSETVENNVIRGYDNEGMGFFNTSGMTFKRNLVTSPTLTTPAPPNGAAQDGIFSGSGTSNDAHIVNNSFDHASSFPGTDIGLSYDSGSNPVISGNSSTGGATFVTVFNSTGAQVTDNTFNGDPNLTGSVIYIGGGDTNTTVSGNTVTGGYYGVALRNNFGDGPNASTTIASNSLTSNYGGGISVAGTAITSGETVQAHRNDLSDNPYGVNNTSAGQVDATCNYWGAADGPGPVGPGSGSGVSTSVDYNPWLISPSGRCIGGAVPKTFDDCKDGGWRYVQDEDGNPFKNQGQCIVYVLRHDHVVGGHVGYDAYGLQRSASFAMDTATQHGGFAYRDANGDWYTVDVSDVNVDGNRGWFAGRVTRASNPSWVGQWLFAEVRNDHPDQIWGSFANEAAAEAGVAGESNPADGPFDVNRGALTVH